MKTNVKCETLSVEEAGLRLGLGRNKAYEAVQSGMIPSLRFGRKIVVPRQAVDRLLASAGNNKLTEGAERHSA
jgi:excisionase family DNA binding protein